MPLRAVVIVNPNATRTTPRGRDVLASALTGEVETEVVLTQARGHASEIARKAVAADVDVIVVLGGDGTVNEVVNGMLADVTPDYAAAHIPLLGIVPGGSTNVLARAVGLPRDPVEATGALLESLRRGSARTIGLGRANDRFFTFGAGLGLDAEVVELVERRRDEGARSTAALWVRTAARHLLTKPGRHAAQMSAVSATGEVAEAITTLIVSNSTPWTYLGSRAIHANPTASFDSGLDVLALLTARRTATVRMAASLLRPEGPRGRRTLRWVDVAGVTVRASQPVAAQVDGDYLGVVTEMRFCAVPDALRIAVPGGSESA